MKDPIVSHGTDGLSGQTPMHKHAMSLNRMRAPMYQQSLLLQLPWMTQTRNLALLLVFNIKPTTALQEAPVVRNGVILFPFCLVV